MTSFTEAPSGRVSCTSMNSGIGISLHFFGARSFQARCDTMSLMSGQLQSRAGVRAPIATVIQTGATVMDQLFSVGLQQAQVRVSALPDIRAGEAALVKRHV